MKLNFNKKIVVGIIVFLLALVLIAVGYFYFNPYKTISYDGFSFSYPKEYEIKKAPRPSGGLYEVYTLESFYPTGFNRSKIRISEPIENDDKPRNLSNYVRTEFISLVIPITINNLTGEYVSYHLDEQLLGDRHVQAQITKIYLQSNFKNTPIVLTYYRYDADHSLEKAWEVILKTLKHKNGVKS